MFVVCKMSFAKHHCVYWMVWCCQILFRVWGDVWQHRFRRYFQVWHDWYQIKNIDTPISRCIVLACLTLPKFTFKFGYTRVVEHENPLYVETLITYECCHGSSVNSGLWNYDVKLYHPKPLNQAYKNPNKYWVLSPKCGFIRLHCSNYLACHLTSLDYQYNHIPCTFHIFISSFMFDDVGCCKSMSGQESCWSKCTTWQPTGSEFHFIFHWKGRNPQPLDRNSKHSGHMMHTVTIKTHVSGQTTHSIGCKETAMSGWREYLSHTICETWRHSICFAIANEGRQ